MVDPIFPANELYTIRRLHFTLLKALARAVLEEHLVAFGDVLLALGELQRDEGRPSYWSVSLHNVLTLNELQSAADNPSAFVSEFMATMAFDMFHVTRTQLAGIVRTRSRWLFDGAQFTSHYPLEDASISLAELLGGTAR